MLSFVERTNVLRVLVELEADFFTSKKTLPDFSKKLFPCLNKSLLSVWLFAVFSETLNDNLVTFRGNESLLKLTAWSKWLYKGFHTLSTIPYFQSFIFSSSSLSEPMQFCAVSAKVRYFHVGMWCSLFVGVIKLFILQVSTFLCCFSNSRKCESGEDKDWYVLRNICN